MAAAQPEKWRMVMTGEEILVQALNWTLVYVREVALDTLLPLTPGIT